MEKNKYHYKYNVNIYFDGTPSKIDNIEKLIEDKIKKSIKSLKVGDDLEITSVSLYITHESNMTEYEKTETKKAEKAKKADSKFIQIGKLSPNSYAIMNRFLGGTTDHHYLRAVYQSDSHLIIKLPGRTVHLQRTDYAYSPTEYYVMNVKNSVKAIEKSPYSLQSMPDFTKTDIIAFHTEGRLKKEDREKIYKIIGERIKL